MSTDTRELILARMLVIMEGMKTDVLLPADERFVTVTRNRGKLDNDKLHAGYLLDGDEDSVMTGTGRGRRKMLPVYSTMRPQVFVVLKATGPEKDKNLLLGPLINKFRGNLIHRFAIDATLLSLIGPEGEISYNGMTTDLKSGMPMDGQALLNFAIRHLVNPYA